MNLRTVLLPSVLLTALVVACSGDDATAPPGAAPGATDIDASTAPPDQEEPNQPPADGGGHPGEQDAGLITDGGGGDPDVEPDGGIEVDAGSDAGTCGPPAGDGPTTKSSCSSALVKLGGGTITAGTYDLDAFTVTGTLQFCGTYTPGTYSGRLDVAIAGKGKYLLHERAVRTGVFNLKPNKSFLATLNGNYLDVTQTCGTAVSTPSWGYTVGVDNGKPTITYTHASGTATVRYRWIMR